MEAPSRIGQESHAASYGTVSFGIDSDTRMLYSQGYAQWRVPSSKWLRMVTCTK